MRSHQEGGKTATNNITNTTSADTFQQVQDAKLKSSKCKLVKSKKPLVNYKFYLDIERHNIFLKIESRIRELGGSIEFFLTKDITHFITDKKESNNCSIIASPSQQHQQSPGTTVTNTATPQTPLTPNYLSPTVARTPSSNDLKGSSKIKTRADAMLHRARKGTCEAIIDSNNRKSSATTTSASVTTSATAIATNPTQIAESLGTPVWDTEYALKFLEKVYSYIKERYVNNTNYPKTNSTSSLKHKTKNAQIFKGNFIKIESSQKHYRPYYKIFNSKWPVINLKPQKKGAFPLTAVDENYFFNSETKTIAIAKQQKTGKTVAAATNSKFVTAAAAAAAVKIKNKSSTATDLTSKMTRKNRSSKPMRVKTTTTTTTATTTTTNPSNKQNFSSDKQCGFCEICRVEYDALTVHLKSESHMNFVKNENNFLALDSLIKSTANVDKFLSLNNKANIQYETNPCDLCASSKRTSKRISNNGSQLKPSLQQCPLLHPPPPTPPNICVIKEKEKLDSKQAHERQHQIAILEKTTTIGHTRQTRQQTSFGCRPSSPPTCINNLDNENSITGVVRARRQSVKKINYAEPKEDEEILVDELITEFNHQQRKKKSKSKDKDKITIENSSPEIKPLPLPTSLLYKVVETNDKSKRDLMKELEVKSTLEENDKYIDEQKQKQASHEEQEPKQPSPIIVKIRKVRQSELSILSGEAVNFMFPKMRISSDPTDIDRQTTSDGRRGSSSTSCTNTSINSPEKFQLTDRATVLKRKHSNSSVSAIDVQTKNELTPKKKRRLDIEINEEKTNIKETNVTTMTPPKVTAVSMISAEETDNHKELRSSPRLSLQRNRPIRTYERKKIGKKKFNQSVNKASGQNDDEMKSCEGEHSVAASVDKKEMPKIPSLDDIVNEKLAKYKFAFERLPNNELWYQVFHRQDEGYEKSFEYFGSTDYRKLPYEMGPLPPLQKSLCVLCHMNTSSKNTECTAVTSSSQLPDKEPCTDHHHNHQYPLKKENISEDQHEAGESSVSVRKHKKTVNSRASALVNLEMPRKSPREHASTLAILSCLLQRKNAQHQDRKQETQQSITLSDHRIKKEPNNDAMNSEICTQISENVKRLRRGEKTSVTSSMATAGSSSSLPDMKKRIKIQNKKNIRKFSSSPFSRRNMRLEMNDFKSNKKIADEKHVNVLKLKKDVDAFLTSNLNDDTDLLDLSSQISLPNINSDGFTHFAKDVDLSDLFEKNDINYKSTSMKNVEDDIGSCFSGSVNGSNRLRLFRIYPTSKKRKNKTGWPTTKKRTVTRQQHTRQHQQELSRKGLLGDINGVIKSETSCEMASSTAITSTTINNSTATTTTTTTRAYSKNENDMNNLSTHSPITPPESDDDGECHNNDHIGNEEDEDDDDDDERIKKNQECDISSAKSRRNSILRAPTTLNLGSTHHHLQNHHLPLHHHHHPQYHHHHHQQQQQHQHNLSASEKTDVSDIFAVSSDSLDTVLDVGSQIKSEDQEEIIASSKCNGNKLSDTDEPQQYCHSATVTETASRIVDDENNGSKNLIIADEHVKIMSPKRISNNNTAIAGLSKKMKIPNSIKLKVEGKMAINCHNNSVANNLVRQLSSGSLKDVKVVIKKEKTVSCGSELSGSSENEFKKRDREMNTATTNEGNNNPSNPVESVAPPESSIASSISPRRLRKPRGRWYRER